MITGGRALGWEVIVLKCHSAEDFDTAFATLVERRASALIVSAFPAAYNNRAKVLTLAEQYKIPAIYSQSQYSREGGLIAYGPKVDFRRVAVDYLAPILKGAKPADLPIQQPTKYELIINLKAAKALGLLVPPTLIAIADEVIE
jgi:putative ABC transport system substrate-binding protein